MPQNRPISYGTALNQYVRYPLTSKLKVPQVFYIGIWQNDEIPVAVGFDLNTNRQSDIFFQNTSLNWVNTTFKGALMIRPEFYTAVPPIVSVDPDLALRNDGVSLWPNPVTNNRFMLQIDGNSTGLTGIKIQDVSGREITSSFSASEAGLFSIELPANTPAGIYFIEINIENNGIQSRLVRRIIIQPN